MHANGLICSLRAIRYRFCSHTSLNIPLLFCTKLVLFYPHNSKKRTPMQFKFYSIHLSNNQSRYACCHSKPSTVKLESHCQDVSLSLLSFQSRSFSPPFHAQCQKPFLHLIRALCTCTFQKRAYRRVFLA